MREAYATARPGAPREAVGRALRGELAAAIADAYECDVRLGVQWGWLDRHQGHERYDEREAAFLAREREYAALEDAIAEAMVALGLDTERTRAWATDPRRDPAAFAAWGERVLGRVPEEMVV